MKKYYKEIWSDYKKWLDNYYSDYQNKISDLRKKISMSSIEDGIIFSKYEIKLKSIKRVIDNQYFHYSVSNINERFLINKSMHEVDFSSVDDATLIPRNDEISMAIMGYGRADNAREIIENFNSFYNIDTNEDLYEKAKKYAQRQINEEQKLWEETNSKDFFDIFETIDIHQKAIVKDVVKPLDATINGFAGTGKTIIGYELAKILSNTTLLGSVFIVPNSHMKFEAKMSFREANINKIKVYTYGEMELNIKGIISGYISNELSTSFYPRGEFNGVKINESLIFIIEKHIGIITNVRNGNYKLNKFKEEIMKTNLKYNLGNFSGEVMTLKINSLFSTIKKEQFGWLLKNIYLDMVLSNEEIAKGLKIMSPSQLFLDEAPRIIAYDNLKKYMKTMNFPTIKIYDKFQYKPIECEELERLFSRDEKRWNLDIIYRTTQEIFEWSAPKNISANEYKAGISFIDSLQVVEKPSNEWPVVKVSELISNHEFWIGREIMGLNIIIDIDDIMGIENIIYMMATRARKILNIIYTK